MRLIAIANISDGKDTVGFRLLDIDTKQVKDIPLDNIISVLNSSDIQIDNLRVEHNTIIGYNGAIDRLPKVVNKQLVGKSPLIVVNQIGDQGFTVSDYRGYIKRLKNEDMLDYVKTQGISNGKLVHKDWRKFIYAIDGHYRMDNSREESIGVTGFNTGEEFQTLERISDGKNPIHIKIVTSERTIKANAEIIAKLCGVELEQKFKLVSKDTKLLDCLTRPYTSAFNREEDIYSRISEPFMVSDMFGYNTSSFRAEQTWGTRIISDDILTAIFSRKIDVVPLQIEVENKRRRMYDANGGYIPSEYEMQEIVEKNRLHDRMIKQAIEDRDYHTQISRNTLFNGRNRRGWD